MQQLLFSCPKRRAVLTVVAGVVAGCHNAVEARPNDPCRETYEFGNTGCFEVRGQVVDRTGEALAGISVGPRPRSTSTGFNTHYVLTDSAGRFRVRLARVAAPAPGAPDTLTVYMIAVDPRSPMTRRDSVLATVTVARVGAVPTPAEVRITLGAP